MEKAIPKIGSCKKVRIRLCRNARFSLRKSARRITKGVIHVKASFNNTEIITLRLCLSRKRICASMENISVPLVEGKIHFFMQFYFDFFVQNLRKTNENQKTKKIVEKLKMHTEK